MMNPAITSFLVRVLGEQAILQNSAEPVHKETVTIDTDGAYGEAGTRSWQKGKGKVQRWNVI